MGLLLAAKIGEETQLVGRLVTVVEIQVHALPNPGAALTHDIGESGRRCGEPPVLGPKLCRKRTPMRVVLDSEEASALVILELTGQGRLQGCN